jgi:hypothetical protein
LTGVLETVNGVTGGSYYGAYAGKAWSSEKMPMVYNCPYPAYDPAYTTSDDWEVRTRPWIDERPEGTAVPMLTNGSAMDGTYANEGGAVVYSWHFAAKREE